MERCVLNFTKIVSYGSVKSLQNISLYGNTVAERVIEMAGNKVIRRTQNLSLSLHWVLTACDESTQVHGVAQLAVFLRAVDRDINVYDVVPELVPFHDTI